MPKGKVSKPMKIVALRLSEEERDKLQRIADEHGVTLSWVLRQGARLYADDLGRWLAEQKDKDGGGLDERLAAS